MREAPVSQQLDDHGQSLTVDGPGYRPVVIVDGISDVCVG
jgi:hypothetical protein